MRGRSISASAARVAPHDGHLTADQQADALSQWGRAGSFRCCACDRDASVQASVSVKTTIGLHLATCRPCALKLSISPAYRRETRARADAAAMRALWQRVADLAGIRGAALLDAFLLERAPLRHDSMPPLHVVDRVELRLSLPPGSVSGAILKVFGARALQ